MKTPKEWAEEFLQRVKTSWPAEWVNALEGIVTEAIAEAKQEWMEKGKELVKEIVGKAVYDAIEGTKKIVFQRCEQIALEMAETARKEYVPGADQRPSAYCHEIARRIGIEGDK